MLIITEGLVARRERERRRRRRRREEERPKIGT